MKLSFQLKTLFGGLQYPVFLAAKLWTLITNVSIGNLAWWFSVNCILFSTAKVCGVGHHNICNGEHGLSYCPESRWLWTTWHVHRSCNCKSKESTFVWNNNHLKCAKTVIHWTQNGDERIMIQGWNKLYKSKFMALSYV